MKPLGVGLYGSNGHQIQALLNGHPRAEAVAWAALAADAVPPDWQNHPAIRRCNGLDAMLEDPRVELVSLCSPRRADQAADAIRCLRAGRHVYAEKPCALSEAELDAVLAAASASGRVFRDMGGTVFAQPYWAMREVVQAGRVGAVVQVFVQKSYPYHDRRPQDEAVDGGLILQVGVHAARIVEHVSGRRVEAVSAVDTNLGNPGRGGLRMAASLQMRLAGGGLATGIVNYLNMHPTGIWGYEEVRVFGTEGFVESLEGGARTRLVTRDRDWGALDVRRTPPDYFDCVAQLIHDGTPMPFSLEDDLHPTRVVLRAQQDAWRRRAPSE